MSKILLLGLGVIVGIWVLTTLYDKIKGLYDKHKKNLDKARLEHDDWLMLRYAKGAKISHEQSLLSKPPKPFEQPEFKSQAIKQLYLAKIEARKRLCGHLGIWVYERVDGTLYRFKRVKKPVDMEQEPCFELAKQEILLYAELESEQSLEISSVIDAIYELESECFRTHEGLILLAESLSVLENFEPNEAVIKTGCFHFYTKPPIYDKISAYNGRVLRMSFSDDYKKRIEFDDIPPQFVINESKYALNAYDKDSLHQIKLAKRCLKRIQLWLVAQKAWLDELVSSQKDFKSHFLQYDKSCDIQPYRPGMGSITAKQNACDALGRPRLQKADFEKFTQAEQDKIAQLARQAERIHWVITSDFAKDGRCKGVRGYVDGWRQSEQRERERLEKERAEGHKKPKREYKRVKNFSEFIDELIEKSKKENMQSLATQDKNA